MNPTRATHPILVTIALLTACSPAKDPIATDTASTGSTADTADTADTAGSSATSDTTADTAPETTATDTTAASACGDGQLDPGEECDDGDLEEGPYPGCSEQCKRLATCPGDLCAPQEEYCTAEARVNATIEGMTPLGPFSGTFAAYSGASIAEDLGTMVIVPAYDDGDFCESGPRLLIVLGSYQWEPLFTVQAPVRYIDGEGVAVETYGQLTVHECCEVKWFCDCKSDTPFWIELEVEGQGWSLSGSAKPNCCRSFSLDEAA